MKNIINLLQKYKIHHLLFWLIYYVGWVQVYKGFYSQLSDLLMVTLIFTLSHGSMYYTIQYVSIPRLLKRKKIKAFIIVLLAQLVVTTALMYITLSFIVGRYIGAMINAEKLQFMLTLAFSNIFITALLISIKAFLDYLRNQKIEEKKERERLEAELQYLKAQVNPHFLFNTINSVYVLINQDPDKASETLIKLSDLLRAQLYDFGKEKISIDEEINYLKNYIELERMRRGEKQQFGFEVSPEVKCFRIAPLMLMPFLENCFKHAMPDASGKTTILITLQMEGERLNARFFNTKDAEPNRYIHLPGGIGLKNIRRRLLLLYPNAHKLQINDLTDSFEVILTLKIK